MNFVLVLYIYKKLLAFVLYFCALLTAKLFAQSAKQKKLKNSESSLWQIGKYCFSEGKKPCLLNCFAVKQAKYKTALRLGALLTCFAGFK